MLGALGVSLGAFFWLKFWGAFWWLGLAVRVIEIFGSWGKEFGILILEILGFSELFLGDKGVLGGVGGWDGGLLGSCRGGPKVKFSRILPETRIEKNQ